MSINLKPLATAFLAMLLLVSCGDEDDSSPTAAASQSNGGLPSGAGEDFPIAIPDDWVIDFYGDIGLTVAGSIRVLYEADRFDDIVAFYDEWTEDQPQDYSRTDTGNGIVIYQRLEGPIYRISVTRDDKRGDERYTRLDAVASSQ